MSKYSKVKDVLIKYKQEHIIEFIDKSSKEIKDKLMDQILKIDFEELKELYNMTFEDIYVDLEELEPIKALNPDSLPKDKYEELEEIGANIVRENKFAVATMAGGQGTRLRI